MGCTDTSRSLNASSEPSRGFSPFGMTIGDLPVVAPIDHRHHQTLADDPDEFLRIAGRHFSRNHKTSIGEFELPTCNPAAARTADLRPSAPTTKSAVHLQFRGAHPDDPVALEDQIGDLGVADQA